MLFTEGNDKNSSPNFTSSSQYLRLGHSLGFVEGRVVHGGAFAHGVEGFQVHQVVQGVGVAGAGWLAHQFRQPAVERGLATFKAWPGLVYVHSTDDIERTEKSPQIGRK